MADNSLLMLVDQHTGKMCYECVKMFSKSFGICTTEHLVGKLLEQAKNYVLLYEA